MVTSLFGMFGSAVALLFGGWDIALQTLVLFMGIDWITGGILVSDFMSCHQIAHIS